MKERKKNSIDYNSNLNLTDFLFKIKSYKYYL